MERSEVIVFIWMGGESGKLRESGEKSVGGIGFSVLGNSGGGKRVGRGKWRDNAVAAHFPEGDFHDLRNGVAVENGSDGIAHIDHDHAKSAVVFVWTGAGLVGIFAGAANRCKAAVHQSDKLADADLGGWLGQRVASELPTVGLDEAGLAELLENPLNKFQRQTIRLGELRPGDGAASDFGRNAEVDVARSAYSDFFERCIR